MANQPINLGTAPLGEDGDTVRQAFTKVNANADELYAASDAAAAKLATIATGATANATDAQLRDRATHTGTQAISTVTGLETELAGKQASNANLNALAGLAGAADRLPYFTGAGALSLTTLTGLARNLLDDTTQSGMQSTLGLVKQTSATDTTAGALMTVGAGGLLGPAVVNNSDLNESVITATYFNGGIGINTPPGFSYGVVTVDAYDANNVAQTAYSMAADRVYFRRKANSYAPWQELFHTGNVLGTVSQSGGVPTGAMFESGSNANGEFVRFADGTQMCFFTKPGGLLTRSAFNRFYYTWPATFVIAPVVSVSVAGGLGSWDDWITLSAEMSSTSGFECVLVTSSTAADPSLHVIATGRWY